MLRKLRRWMRKWTGGAPARSLTAARQRATSSADAGQSAAQPGTAQTEPGAAPDLRSQWIANTLACLGQSTPKRDGRLHIRGNGVAELCASASLAPEAVAVLDGWLVAMQRAGFQLEMRPVDGWQLCVVSGGALLPIRVRERMRATNALQGANFLLEQWLGGKRGRNMTPSGELELQVLRHGSCAGAFPVDLLAPAAAYQQSLDFLKDLQQRELVWQRKSRSRAAHRRLVNTPRAYRATPPEAALELQPSAVLANADATMGLPPVDDLTRVATLLQELDLTLKRVHPKTAEHLRMRSSLSRLAHACQMPPENSLGRDLGRLHGLLQGLEAQQEANRPFLTARKRVVA